MNNMIKKIELDLGGKIVSLTPEQAKNLKDALDDLFGERVIREIVREYVHEPYPLPYHPIWTWHQPTHPYLYDATYDVGGTGDTYVGDIYNTDGVSCNSLGTLRLTG